MVRLVKDILDWRIDVESGEITERKDEYTRNHISFPSATDAAVKSAAGAANKTFEALKVEYRVASFANKVVSARRRN